MPLHEPAVRLFLLRYERAQGGRSGHQGAMSTAGEARLGACPRRGETTYALGR